MLDDYFKNKHAHLEIHQSRVKDKSKMSASISKQLEPVLHTINKMQNTSPFDKQIRAELLDLCNQDQEPFSYFQSNYNLLDHLIGEHFNPKEKPMEHKLCIKKSNHSERIL